MKTQIKTPALIGVIVIVVAGLVFFGMKYIGGAGNLDHGQIAYTPGVPPWQEKDPVKREAYRKMGLEVRDATPQSEGHQPPALVKTTP